MTALTRTVRREVATVYRGRPLVIELHGAYLTVRPKGKRHSVTVSYGAVLDLGYRILARAEAQEKAAAKKRAAAERRP